MNAEAMKKAWDLFDRAVRFEAKALDKTKTDSMRAMAMRACDKKLDEACAAEAAALNEA